MEQDEIGTAWSEVETIQPRRQTSKQHRLDQRERLLKARNDNFPQLQIYDSKNCGRHGPLPWIVGVMADRQLLRPQSLALYIYICTMCWPARACWMSDKKMATGMGYESHYSKLRPFKKELDKYGFIFVAGEDEGQIIAVPDPEEVLNDLLTNEKLPEKKVQRLRARIDAFKERCTINMLGSKYAVRKKKINDPSAGSSD